MITEFINDGESYPAVGVSFGLSSLYELLKGREEFTKSNDIDLYVIPLNTFKDSFIISEELRSIGLKVLLELENKKLKKCLDFANKEEIEYVLIIGEDEIKEEKLQLKNMKYGSIEKVSLKNINKVKDIIKKKNK